MQRRRFLTTGGLALGAVLGGCVSTASDDETPDESSTPDDSGSGTPDSTPKTPDDPITENPVTVENITVRKVVTYESYMGSGGVLAADGTQYVVASITAAEGVSQDDFFFEASDQSWEAGLPDTAGARNYAVAGHEGGPLDAPPESETAFLAFAVSSPLSASKPRIHHAGTGTDWQLSGDAAATLAAPAPQFELDALSVPDEVQRGETLSVSLSATNVSDTAGRFLAAVYWPTERIADDDESHVVDRDVAAGEDVTATLSLDTENTTFETKPVSLSVRGHVSADRSVTVQTDEQSS